MNFKYQYFKFAQNQIRLMSNGKSKNHYNSLGIPSTSTQSEVKAAYYKLSMLYHPDKTQNNPDSSKKFRDITAAYEVLGNVKTRKLYDKGLYFDYDTTTDDAVDKFHRSRESRSRPPPPTGRTPIYDFDEWSRNHYGATFQRRMEQRQKRQFYQNKRQQDINDVKMEKLFFIIGVCMILCMYIFQSDKSSYDNVTNFGGSMPVRHKETEE